MGGASLPGVVLGRSISRGGCIACGAGNLSRGRKHGETGGRMGGALVISLLLRAIVTVGGGRTGG